MRESIGGVWLTQLIIIFMLVFVAFLALTLNYTKAFKLKNEVTTIIEKYEGLTKDSIPIINNYLKNNGYSITRTCPKGSYGVSNLDSQALKLVTDNDKNKYYYCITKIKSPSMNNSDKVFYKINLFLKFNLPVLGDIFTFDINGSTGDVPDPADKLQAKEE